jgi:type IV pilus assembly protein PilB
MSSHLIPLPSPLSSPTQTPAPPAHRAYPLRPATADAEAPAVSLLNDILRQAAARQASDLHIERGARDWRIRVRIDGVLHLLDAPPSHLRDALIARVKALAGLDIAERRLPQDGRLSVRISVDRNEDFRVSTLPTVHGEKIVLRRLETLPESLSFETSGFDEHQQATLMRALEAPHGMVLVTGPTGSGKTRSLFCFLQAINNPGVNICTVEDPVEIRLPGITQVSVREKAGLGFAGVLRAFLRQDPDVLMIGEIRDAETADIAVKAAQTGHRVLSTLHTNDAPSTLIRLRDIGVAPYKLASTLRLITAQRLMRRLCMACRTPDPLAASRWQPDDPAANTDGTPLYWRATGCALCHDIGYQGRFAIHQIMPISDVMRELIATGAPVAALAAQARDEGVPTLYDAALARVRRGDTSLAEMDCVVGKQD